MAEGAERFRGLWEDEMFARQCQDKQSTVPVSSDDVQYCTGRTNQESFVHTLYTCCTLPTLACLFVCFCLFECL